MRLMNDGIDDKNMCREFELLYRATSDGWECRDFMNKCLGKSDTITIIQTVTNNVFAGFVSIEWPDDTAWHPDPQSFIMLIRSNKGYKPETFKTVNSSYPYVVYHDATYMFIIGDFHMRILANCNNHFNSYTDQHHQNTIMIKIYMV